MSCGGTTCAATAMTCASSGRPPISCRTFARFDLSRVPLPAAMMTIPSCMKMTAPAGTRNRIPQSDANFGWLGCQTTRSIETRIRTGTRGKDLRIGDHELRRAECRAHARQIEVDHPPESDRREDEIGYGDPCHDRRDIQGRCAGGNGPGIAARSQHSATRNSRKHNHQHTDDRSGNTCPGTHAKQVDDCPAAPEKKAKPDGVREDDVGT